MTTKEFAQMLNGREFLNEITREEAELARKNGIVVAYGVDDNLVEFKGAIEAELGACDGKTLYLSRNGKIYSEDYYVMDCAEEIDLLNRFLIPDAITTLFVTDEYCWEYQTEIPHETFDVIVENEKFCRGIVFYLDDVRDVCGNCPFLRDGTSGKHMQNTIC